MASDWLIESCPPRHRRDADWSLRTQVSPPDVSSCAIIFLVLGDMAAALIGVSFGGDNTVPILHSSLGYSVLWNVPAFGSANFSDTTLAWEATTATQIDLWIAVTPASLSPGESPLAPLLRGYVDVTGHAPKLPFWATGFWQCKNRYRNQSQVLDVARGYVKRGLPISVIVIDCKCSRSLLRLLERSLREVAAQTIRPARCSTSRGIGTPGRTRAPGATGSPRI